MTSSPTKPSATQIKINQSSAVQFKENVKTRFAPSPTGYMHFGNLRPILFNALLAGANQGVFLLRIEDTDKVRSKQEYVEAIKADMRWLGLDWQEGPEKNQGNGPYFQSARTDIYERYYDQLIQAGKAYYCFCSPEELTMMRKAQLASGKPPRYNGKCLALTQEAIQEKIASGAIYTIRFRVPKGQIIEYNDLVKGPQHFKTDDFGDFIIRRTDGTSPFVFCNAVDDSMMGVTHVLRGEDHVSNTPLQIMVLQALNMRVPEYGHFSTLRGEGGGKLSKRLGATSIKEFRETGILPETLINYMAHLGCHYEENNTLMSFKELSENFHVDLLGKSPAQFDSAQLEHWQKLAVLALSEQRFWQWCGSQVSILVPDKLKSLFMQTVVSNVLMPDDVLHWAEIFFKDLADFDDEEIQALRNAGSKFYTESLRALAEFGKNYNSITKHLKEQLQVKGKALYLPLRLALTGEWHGPELIHILELLSIDIIEKRLNYALELCN